MPALSIRLSADLDHRLDEEARREGVPRSEVARQAIRDYLARCERERFMAEMVAEARAAYADEAVRRDALKIAGDFRDADDEAFDKAEGRGPGEEPEAEERWWK